MSICAYLLSLLLSLCVIRNVRSSCVFQDGKYDLSALDRSSGWPVTGPSLNGSHYKISICRPLNYSTTQLKGCSKSSVCLVSGNSAISYGNAIENTSDYAIAANIGTGFSLYVLTQTLCKSNGIYRATIHFACGPHLGAPVLMLRSECQVNFFWRTSAACPTKPKNKQVPCYVLDDQGNKRDLSPLIKENDGYLVYTPNPAVDFIINVCSDLSLVGSQVKCPQNASACRVNGKESASFGSISEGLKYTSEGLVLTYKMPDSDSVFPSDCQLKPKTTIFFKCPVRGYSQPPKLISDSNCQYEVEWETEYACPENMLKGDIKSCQFTRGSHGVEIDLSPLRNVPVYNVFSPETSTYFNISVCSGLGYKCGGKNWKSSSVCVYSNTSTTSQIGGTTDSAELMYADGEVILKYMKGSICNETEQMSVINFICDENALNNGSGEPQHVASHECNHIFKWPTKYACLKHPLDTPCSVTYDKKTVNLQKLLLTDGEPWEAVDGRTSKTPGNAEYFINICGQVSKLGNLSMCGEGSSACALNDKGQYINLGNFTSPPVYDQRLNSILLQYFGGSSCRGDKSWQSSIVFKCKLGQINSKPVLTRIDDNECRYEFEWQTADACPTGVIEGSNCKVFDSNLGIGFDLTPLKSQVYKVDSPSYEFYMGICEPVKDSPCTLNKDVGVCQVDKSNHTAWKAGEPTSRLSYMDGVVNLTYLSGDPYDQNHTSRMTIIIFICDYNSRHGNPVFVEAVDFAFVFHWYTDLVCPQSVSTECVVHDPLSLAVYDLTGLSMSKKNWMTIINEDNKERKIYLNVCRSLTLPIGCDPSAAACLVEKGNDKEDKVVISNLGRAINSPVFQSPGHITLTYTNGSTCTSYGENTTYTTLIHFLCVEEDAFQTGFRHLGKVGNCEYSFLWATKAACPTKTLQSVNNCHLTDPDSGFVFDLMTLNSNQPYSVHSPSGRTFQFNICGRVVDGCYGPDKSKPPQNVSACEVNSNGMSILNMSVSDSYILSYTPGEDLTLTYNNKSASEPSDKKVVIKFPCFNSSDESSAKFIGEDDGQYIFELKTSLTCIPETTNECSVIDEFGNEYDLSPLTKYNNGNWEVSDSRPGYSHLKYHINFCRPLNKSPSYKCPGGASSACQTNVKDGGNVGFDLGSQRDELLVSNSGVVIVHYTGGSHCQDNQFRRSTTINLYCSSETGELKFLGETPECEYVFSLDTPVACPLEASHGENCVVRDPLFGYTFNLNPLKNKNNNYNVTLGEYSYVFNVCDKLNGFSNKCSDSGACQLKPKDPDFSKSLGLPSDVLVYRKGLITLEYQSGSGNCHGKYNRTTKITFTCHHALEDKDGPTFIAEAQDCTYLFDWPTVHACPPFDVIECSVVDDDGIYYDLSRLSLPNDNYYVKYPFSNKSFVINVCRSVVHTPNSLCPYTSAACLVDSSSSIDSVNLGVASHPPYFESGKLKISYTTGDPCSEEDVSTARFMQTDIEFICDPALIDSEPRFIGRDGCVYYFEWHTAFACPPKNIENQESCTLTDPATGHLFNFSSFKHHGLFKYKKGDHQYYLSVCGNDSSNPCGPGAGMCQEEISGEKRHWLGGVLNTNLVYKNGILLLNYTNGDSCHGDLYKRNTLVEFHCGPDIGEPEFLYESHDCTYFFSWKTNLACQELMHCAIKNGSAYYDLTTLADSYHTAASSVMNDNASYYISVCSSLGQIPGVLCPPDAAICRMSKDSKTGESVTESLGKVEHPPFVDFMGHATAIFTNGSACIKDPKYQNRARIIFLCEADAGMGEPVLLDYSDDCFFLFEWRTNIVCPEKPEVPSSFMSCNYTDNSRGIHFDVLPLQRTGTHPYYEVSDGSSTFRLNICSSKLGADGTKCNDSSGVCGQLGNDTSNYGIATSQKFRYSGGRLILNFYDGDDCPSGMNGKKTSEVIFVCDPAAGMGEPKIYKKYTCLVVFMWKTSLVCLNAQHQCDFEIDGQHYDFNLLSSISHNWVSTDAKNNTYWINICRGIQPTADTLGCSPTTAVCMSDKNGYHMSLGMVQTMKIKSINSTNLLLTFNNGDTKACTSVSSPAPLHSVTRLFMQCGRSTGRPRIFSGPDDKCYYDFVWETSLACADKTEEIMIEKDGIIKDSRLDFSFDINDILYKTFTVPGNSTDAQYVYKINLSGVAHNSSQFGLVCAKAAVCQTKPDFERDIGSFDTRTFVVRGAELQLVFKSYTRPCGKNQRKVVTTIIKMFCSSAAGHGTPEFMYESGDCDYIFEWPTIVVCPDYHRNKNNTQDPKSNPYQDVPEPHNKAEIAVGIIFGVIAAVIVLFIVVKAERRAVISSRFRSLFGRVSLPYFRYKRFGGERHVLVDASKTVYDDDDMLHC